MGIELAEKPVNKTHHLRMDRARFEQLVKGERTWELRLHDHNIYVGDEVEFFECGGARTARCKVVGIDTQMNEPWIGSDTACCRWCCYDDEYRAMVAQGINHG